MKRRFTWFDIEDLLAKGELEDQDLDTLRALSRVEPESSSNERYHFRFEQAIGRIRHRISELEAASEKKPEGDGHGTEHWWKKPVGIVALMVIGGSIVFIIGSLLKFWYPDIFR